MSNNNKRDKESSDDSVEVESDSEIESENEEAMEINQEIQVDFEGFQMSDNDFHGISRLLRQLFQKENLDISAIADMLISQSFIGTVLKQCETPEDGSDDSDDTDEVFGLTTCLGLSKGSQIPPALHAVVEMLIDHCKAYCNMKKDQALSFLQSCLTDNPSHQIGWVINERFINIPPKISVPMFSKLNDEIATACTKKHKSNYNFTYYLMVCKTCSNNNNTSLHYLNAEEEIFHDSAEISFTYPLPDADPVMTGSWNEESEQLKPCRTVLIMTKQSFLSAFENITLHV